jgi:MFS family permease
LRGTPALGTSSQLTAALVRSTLIAALGGLLFGFDTAMISGTTEALQAVYGLRGFGLGFTVASALIGTIVGGTNLVFTTAAMVLIDRYGRRRLMIAGSVGYIVSLGATAGTFYRYGANFTATGSLIVLVSLLVFIASHAFGQGAVI